MTTRDSQEGTKTLWLAVSASAVAIGAGAIVVMRPAYAIGFLAILLYGFAGAKRAPTEKTYGWVRPVAAVWLGLLLWGEHNFHQDRGPLAVLERSTTWEIVTELLLHSVAGAFVIWAWTGQRRVVHIARPSLFFFGPAVIALLSVAWSQAPLLSTVRAFELTTVTGFAVITSSLSPSRQAREDFFRNFSRTLLKVVTLLTLIGFLVRPWPSDRFTWPGIHTGVASTIVAVGLILMLSTGRRFLRLSSFTYWSGIAIFGVAIGFGATRGVLAGVLVAVAVILWSRGQRNMISRYIALPYFLLLLVLSAMVAFTPLYSYLSRGETGQRAEEGLETLSGRIPLWEISYESAAADRRLMHGYGYGASRVVLYPKVEWAGTAHSVWVDVFLSAGLVGAVIWLLFLLGTIKAAIRELRAGGMPSRAALPLLSFMAVLSVTSDAFALPGFSFSLIVLLGALCLPTTRVDEMQGSAASPKAFAAAH